MNDERLALPTFWETTETIGKIRAKRFEQIASYLAMEDCDAIVERLLKVLSGINKTRTAYKILENAVQLLEVHLEEMKEQHDYNWEIIKKHGQRKETLEKVTLKIQEIYEMIPGDIL